MPSSRTTVTVSTNSAPITNIHTELTETHGTKMGEVISYTTTPELGLGKLKYQN